MRGRQSGAIQLSWGAKACGTDTMRKATATETILGSPPSPLPHGFLGFPQCFHLCSRPTLMGVTRQKEVAPIFVSARAPREGCSSPSSARPTRAHPRRLQGARSGAAAAPLPTSSGPASFPFPRAAPPAPAAPPPPRDLCVVGDFQTLPLLGLAGRPASPGHQSGSKHRRRRQLQAPPAKDPNRHPHPTPPPEMP